MKSNGLKIPDRESLIVTIQEYLDNDVVNCVFILSDEVYALANSDEEFMRKLKGADNLLASNNLMARDMVKNSDGIMVEVPGQERDFSEYEYNSFNEVMMVLRENKSTIFILTQDQKEMEKCNMMLKMDAPDLKSWEMCCEDIETSSDDVLNEINGIAPDVLLCSFDSPFEENWILENKDKMNTKLILGIGPGVTKAKKNKSTIRGILNNIFKKKNP